MFSFTKKQKEFDICGLKIGGQPGKNPTVLFGGFFFKGEPVFKDAKKNLQKMLNISKKTGNPAIPDFFIRKQEYIEPIIDFIKNSLSDNYPFSVDITDPDVKIEVLKKLADENLLNRTIYNSIHVGITKDEQKTLKKFTPQASIVVAFNPKDKSPDGKIEVLENGANLTEKGLLDISVDIGIKKILVDTAALAPGENSGGAIAALPVVKEEYGYPSGCAIHNVVEKSGWLNEYGSVKKIVDAASNLNISMFGGDFAIFGPAQHADFVFPLIAWQDILISEYTQSYFGVKPVDFHPRRIFYK